MISLIDKEYLFKEYSRHDFEKDLPMKTFIFEFQASHKQSQDSEKTSSGDAGKLSPLQALFSPPGLQQMQQFLQHVANNNNNNNGSGLPSGFNPTQLQHFMQQHNLLNHQQVHIK